jgi:TolB-like protein
LARVIERAIDPRPAARHPSAEAVADDLTALAHPRIWPWRSVIGAAIVLIAGVWVVSGTRSGPGPGQDPSPAGAGPTAAGAAAIPGERPVIAVLPLENLSAEPDSDYFADGLTDEIIRNLATVDGLEVRSRTSSFAFKNSPRNLRQVGEQLGANLVVEGSVLRSDRRLRINVQMVRVAGDVPIWSERFDRDLEDVFVVQEEISRAIVNKLRLTLGTGQRRYDTNVEAYELYLRARELVGRRGNPSLEQAADLFQQVLAEDPA